MSTFDAGRAQTIITTMKRAYTQIQAIDEMGKQAVADSSNITQFKGMFRSLDRYFTQYESGHVELTVLYAAAGKKTEYPTESDTKAMTLASRCFYNACTNYERLSPHTPPPLSQTIPSTSILGETSSSHNLPRINVPQFNGQILDWPKFRDIYVSLIHENPALSDIKKFHYLKLALSGPAATAINNLSLEEKNYSAAWNALKTIYDCNRLIGTAYLNQILDFKPHQGHPTVDSYKSFLTKVGDSISAFRLLNIENEATFILFFLASRSLDPKTREQFELSLKDGTKFPSYDDLLTFIRQKCMALELSENHTATSKKTESPKIVDKRNSFKSRNSFSSLVAHDHPSSSKQSTGSSKTNSTPKQCCVCKEKFHSLRDCWTFMNSDSNHRFQLLKNWKGCRICLSYNHPSPSCSSPSSSACKWCQGKHNSLLCLSHNSRSRVPGAAGNGSVTSEPPGVIAEGGDMKTCLISHHSTNILMGTVLAEIKDARGVYQPVRVVLDSASHYSFMTQRCVQKLGLNILPSDRRVSGIGQTPFKGTKGEVNFTMKPLNHDSPYLDSKAIVVQEITSLLPTASLPYDCWRKYLQFPLADPKFFEPSRIDFLLGCDLFAEIWTGSAISVGKDLPKLFPTVFGHVVIGRVRHPDQPSTTPSPTLLCVSSNQELNFDLQKFWELEEPVPNATPTMSPDDLACEVHFQNTHFRKEDGSYVVRLPFKGNLPNFDDSNTVARKCLFNLEGKFRKNPTYHKLYSDFMQEYEEMKHMSRYSNTPKYVLPHHGVLKEEGEQRKIRVVFNGSSKTRNGSLNAFLQVGPKLQADVRIILLNWRTWPVVFIADTPKMYRNIWIHPDDREYQCILWRSTPDKAIETYSLDTVTYGLTPAPFLALRTMKQLIIDEGSEFPLASISLERDRYIDDIAAGGHSVSDALELKSQLIELLKRGNFSLSKWASNSEELLRDVPASQRSSQPISLESDEQPSLKILGLQWDPTTDSFGYKIESRITVFTKRGILSFVAKFYDPLGFISPFVVVLKGFLQVLWKMGLDWDDPIPEDISRHWKPPIEQLQELSQLKIPRFVGLQKPYFFQVIGFSDASTTAYCAALYLRSTKGAQVQVHLLTAKTKLAPLKVISVPRLELCGANLLSQLYQSISGFLSLLSDQIHTDPVFFTDSTIVLGWLNTPSYTMKTFVANRVSQICSFIPASSWRHVASEDNPADIGSRGVFPRGLVNNRLWWSGPSWLTRPEETWPQPRATYLTELPELKTPQERTPLVLLTTDQSSFFIDLIRRFSSYTKLIRVITRIRRLFRRTGNQGGHISLTELEEALLLCVKNTQYHYFFHGRSSEEILHRFQKLNPFLDSHGILRAGGRLYHSSLPYNHKHPILLPNNCHLALLILDHYHKIFLHPGPSLLQALVQTKFWIPAMRKLAQQRTFHCLKCYKLKASILTPKMADLPSFRVKGVRAFLHVGTDFAGPFIVRESLRRRAATYKVYMCLFICLATKAIHLEVVTSLSTSAFLSAFDRFTARRGLPTEVISDNGSNYVSAASQLRELWKWYQDAVTHNEIIDFAGSQGVQWRFNPPLSPHFGGIWEAGVKSAKRIIQRAVGETPLTYEELATLFSRCEAVLNSRPLCPLSSDPSETDYLSPGHFLVGTHLVAQPEPSLLDTKLNTLDRWQLVTRMSQHFWKRWKLEYLSTLQSRPKWTQDVPNLQAGQLVLLKDVNTPVMQWPLAKIVTVYPGKDDIVRVVAVQTAQGKTYTRPVAKLVPLLPATSPYSSSSSS